MVFSEEFARRRKRCGLTENDIESVLCLRKGTVKKWESGKKIPTSGVLALLSNLLLCTADDLLGENKNGSEKK